MGDIHYIEEKQSHADCLIRILDWFGHEGLDVDEIVRQKMAYNRGRPYKHGKRC